MKKTLNRYGQTSEWEDACLGYRRNLWWRKRRLKKLDIARDDKVLDLGCGDGLNMVLFRELGIKNVIGVDISKKILDEAKKNNPINTFYLASAEDLPFKTGEFDVVFLDSVFHHLLQYKPALKEIHRVLKRGGYLYFLEPHNNWLRRTVDFFSLSPLTSWIPILRDRHEHFSEGELPFMRRWLKAEKTFNRLIRSLGMKEVSYTSDIMTRIGKFVKV